MSEAWARRLLPVQLAGYAIGVAEPSRSRAGAGPRLLVGATDLAKAIDAGLG